MHILIHLFEDIEKHKYQIIILSPETLCIGPFTELMRNMEFARTIKLAVIDEAHLILEWASFRNAYTKLSRLRSFLPAGCPISLCSATLTPKMLTSIKTDLGLDDSSLFLMDLGNERINITHSVETIETVQRFEPLKFILNNMTEKVMIFIDNCNLCKDACLFLRDEVAQEDKPKIDFYHAKRSEYSKRIAMRDFRSGVVTKLIITASGMVVRVQSQFKMAEQQH